MNLNIKTQTGQERDADRSGFYHIQAHSFRPVFPSPDHTQNTADADEKTTII